NLALVLDALGGESVHHAEDSSSLLRLGQDNFRGVRRGAEDANSLVACGHFSRRSSIITGVLAWMLCLRPAGMWTQVPDLASCLLSPSVTVASPWRKCSTAGIEAVCSDSSSPLPKPKITAFIRSSFSKVRLKMPFSGGWTSIVKSLKCV